MNKDLVTILLLVVFVLLAWFIISRNFKKLKVPSVCLVTGGVKTGKSLLCVNLSLKDYKKRHRIWWLKTKLLRKDIEEPLYYTNVKISFGDLRRKKRHRLDKNIRSITLDLMMRETRFNYGSVIYIQESSLLADNMDYNNQTRNVNLSLYNKLIAHETRGGIVYYDTQSILDSHYSIKRVASTYLFIQKQYNFFLFHILYVREMINTENGVNNFVDDVDLTTRKIIIPFWYHHKYDRYEFSYLTDTLDKSPVLFEKNKGLISFNPLYIKYADKRTVIENLASSQDKIKQDIQDKKGGAN